MSEDRKIFKANGWQQFCVLRVSDHESLTKNSHIKINNNVLLLVITQTCDLINNLEKEPFFEVACLRPLEKKISVENEHARNSRRIELTVSLNGGNENYYILAHEKFFIEHKLLKNIKPFDKIKCENTKTKLVKWLTSRYSRTAFPDKFDQRWKGRKKNIEKVIKKFKLIEDIYLKIVPFKEIENDEKYDLEILLLMDADKFNDAITYKQCNDLGKELEEQFTKCIGINIELVGLRSNAELTIKEIQEYRRWDYSYLSFRDPERHDHPNFIS